MNYKIQQNQPHFVYDKDNFDELQQQLDELNAELNVREIEVTFKGDRLFFGNVTSSDDVYQFIRETILKGIDVQEHFVAMYLSQANKIIGYYHHSTGTINSTTVDVEIVSAVALKTLAKAVIISHNHPSGNLKPSEADRVITKRLKEALALYDIRLLDHIITTKEGYYSFLDENERSLGGIEKSSTLETKLRGEILKQLKRVTEANAPNLYELLHSKEGYKKAEEMVIRKVLHDQMIPAAVIPLIEQELEMM